jgi:peptidyl-prolyl cis-trans isomerase SurA
LSAAQFQQAMRQAGFDPQTFKSFLRANMAWAQIVQSRFRATVDITEQDVVAALTGREAAPEEQRKATEYLVQQIIFVVPGGAGAGVVAQQQKEAAAFRSAFQGCEQSLQQASGKAGVVVKPPVRREEGQLGANLRAKLAGLEVGGVTQPEKVPEGIQLLAVCAKSEIAGQTEAAVEAREEISSERGQLLARRYLRDLRSDAVIEYR